MSNKVLLFNTQEEANEFLRQPLKVMEALEFELEEDEVIDEYEIFESAGEITCIKFYCMYAHDVIIKRMCFGKYIKNT